MADLLSIRGIPFNQERLIKELDSWLSCQSVFDSILRNGIATPTQLALTRLAMRDTLTNGRARLSPEATAVCMLQILSNRKVRMQIAKLMSSVHRMARPDAMRELWKLKEWAEDHYQVTEHGTNRPDLTSPCSTGENISRDG